jgi:hypothetical protein
MGKGSHCANTLLARALIAKHYYDLVFDSRKANTLREGN